MVEERKLKTFFKRVRTGRRTGGERRMEGKIYHGK